MRILSSLKPRLGFASVLYFQSIWEQQGWWQNWGSLQTKNWIRTPCFGNAFLSNWNESLVDVRGLIPFVISALGKFLEGWHSSWKTDTNNATYVLYRISCQSFFWDIRVQTLHARVSRETNKHELVFFLVRANDVSKVLLMSACCPWKRHECHKAFEDTVVPPWPTHTSSL